MHGAGHSLTHRQGIFGSAERAPVRRRIDPLIRLIVLPRLSVGPARAAVGRARETGPNVCPPGSISLLSGFLADGSDKCDVRSATNITRKKLDEGTMPSTPSLSELEDRVAKLQRAVYYLIWKRTGFGEQCVHCGHAYPGHAEKCKAAEVEALVR